MAHTTITVNTQAHSLLKQARAPGESFSDVIIRTVKPASATCGELLEALTEFEGVCLIPPQRRALLRSGRGRRSNRKARHAAA